jgi:glycerol kinase
MGSDAYILAIDQGTTSTRAILFDTAGRARAAAQIELTQHYPRPGWVEHDPEDIWRSVVSTCREASAAADGPIAAIGIANQRETTILWERATGRPVGNAIVWQDRRTAELCERWRAAGLAEIVASRTGLVVDPYFSASKIRWLLDSVPGFAPADPCRRDRLRHDRQFPVVAPHRRAASCDRRHQRRAHDVVRHPAPRLGS